MSVSSARPLIGRRVATLGVAAVFVALFDGATRANESPAIRIEIYARAIVPGELVRVRVRFEQPVMSVAGSFLQRDLTFLPEQEISGATGGATGWWAWALVDLGRKPATAIIEVQARTANDGQLRAEKAVRVHSKKFPTQKLSVESKYVSPPAETLERIAREREEMAAVYAARSVAPLPRGAFVRPVPGPPTSTFGAHRVLNGQARDPHPGLDLKAPVGTPVVAAGPGRVAMAQDLYFSGGTVVLDHGGGLFTVYAHLSRIDVAKEAAILQGETVGLSGATGRVTGPHLHWGAKIGDLPFDPTALLDSRLFP